MEPESHDKPTEGCHKGPQETCPDLPEPATGGGSQQSSQDEGQGRPTLAEPDW